MSARSVLAFLPLAVPLDEWRDEAREDPRIEALEDRLSVNRFVRSLPDMDRRIIHAIFWRENSQAEVAVLLGLHPRAVSRRLARILEAGKEVMDDEAFFQVA